MGRFVGPRTGWALAGIGIVALFFAALAFHPAMTPAERASWTAQLADRRTYPDTRLRDMEEAADPEMAALMKAELARRITPTPQGTK